MSVGWTELKEALTVKTHAEVANENNIAHVIGKLGHA